MSRVLDLGKAIAGIIAFLGFGLPSISAQERADAIQIHAPKIDLFSKRPLDISTWKYQAGDRAEWAALNFDDRAWNLVSSEILRNPQTHWVRTDVILEGNIDDSDVLALQFIHWPPAFEVYWDGALVGRSGAIDSRGKFSSSSPRLITLRLSRERTGPGRHVLALRLAFNRPPSWSCCAAVSIGYYSTLQDFLASTLDSSRMYTGLYLAAVLFSLFFFLGGWKSPSLLFLCGYAFYHLIYNLEHIAGLTGAPLFPLSVTSEPISTIGGLLSNLMLLLFLLWHLEVPRKAVHVVVLMLGTAAVAFGGFAGEHWGMTVQLLLWAYGLTLCAYRLWKKAAGAGFALAGFGVQLAFLSAEITGIMRYICTRLPTIPWPLVITGLFLACLLGSISLKIRDRARRLQALQIRSKRLEAELLKKSIQPHFIMNTLFSIKTLATKNPEAAEKLIEALAEEFRIICRIAGEREIDAAEEIDLCRRHLELMGLRRDAVYRMNVEGPWSGEKVPPMIFHTLIENGLTHSYQPKEYGTFRLICERNEKGRTYRLRNDGSRIASLQGFSAEKVEEGMGLKYIKARLEESYPGRWRLTCGVREGFWETEIILLAKA